MSHQECPKAHAGRDEVTDKLTPLMTAALTRAASAQDGAMLVGTKSVPGLFAATAAAKAAAKKAIEEGLLVEVRSTGRYVASEKGLTFLISESSPKQVLEDLCRVLEAREGEVSELVKTARRMADQLAGLRSVVDVVLPRVTLNRTQSTQTDANFTRAASSTGILNGDATMTATLASPATTSVADPTDDLSGTVMAHLADWSASAAAGQDCPLPELFRSLSLREPPPTIGTFHDCLRKLHAEGRVYLHPWTGPLYALPEPAYALLSGHNVAYYASVR